MAEIHSFGYVMSNDQLSDLWHYDMHLANMTMKLPLRKCSAAPSCLSNFPRMGSTAFQELKDELKNMWMFAALIFQCRKGERGWGLYFSEAFETHARIFNEKKPMVMGWLAKVPSPDVCPTGHRYLRSPCCNENFPVYLGGPASLVNFDEIDRVLFKPISSNHGHINTKVGMYKAPRRKVLTGLEVLWSYNLSAKNCHHPHYYPESDWQVGTCCSEGQEIDSPLSVLLVAKDDEQPVKRRKVCARPLMSQARVASYRPCTYCGLNLAQFDTGKKYVNMKRHWALKHSAHLCEEMGVVVDNEAMPVSAKDFIKHLDKVDLVFNSLNAHSYKVVPASNFFEISGTPLLPEEASDEEKEAVFNLFLAEAKSAFKKYQVVYLKGICNPKNYKDLLKPIETSNYKAVHWKENCPSGTNFSLLQYELSEDEEVAHKLDVETQFRKVVAGCL
ncbi:uncharacterized protein LOC117648059 [Thrips palmi]|uniref:Uncharacterized protein LOC117648059 n=1 Tax=Thrips palmi TaxID=161013 RepID=A0A6P8Z753_THRPL|nr:uncharacterized protein LOC117648059 [Thrips palmi]